MASAFTKNASELQSFLGFAGYYQSFVVGLAQTAKPLHQLVAQHSKKQLAKDSWFQWTPTCQVAFETVISKLTSLPVLAYPDFSLPFTLHTDASRKALELLSIKIVEPESFHMEAEHLMMQNASILPTTVSLPL